MIPGGMLRRNFAGFKYRELKSMNNEEEKYRIKPRKKYARQVWSINGKAVIVEPIEKREDLSKENERDLPEGKENREEV